jgi:hypothetical protein
VFLTAVACAAAAAADERLDNEQTRVQGLEDIVGQLEARLEELSQMALSAPSSGEASSEFASACMLAILVQLLRSQKCLTAHGVHPCVPHQRVALIGLLLIVLQLLLCN